MKSQLQALLVQALASLSSSLGREVSLPASHQLDATKDRRHGDFATNLALVIAKPLGQPPRAVADLIIKHLPASTLVARTEIAGPGFINFFLNADSFTALVADIIAAGDRYGRDDSKRRGKVVVEFVSANPTGPLHVGHGRGAAVGDCLARLYEAAGWEVTREFYYHDAGAQISNLGASVHARIQGIAPEQAGWPENGYRGDYIVDVAKAYLAGETVIADDREVTATADADDLAAITAFAVAYLRREQDADLKAFGVAFDIYSLESALYTEGKVEDTVAALIASGHTFEQDDALWLRTTAFGDDKDRVMRKRDGGYTYFLPDVAYHVGKWQRGYTRAVNEQGSDHHGTIARVRAGLQALDLGIPKDWPSYVLHQMVTVMRGGEEVKISKRAGSYVTLRDLIDEVGRDATRYFLTARKSDSHLVFDVDLARSKSDENPVYYIQYAHARICSVLRQAEERGMAFDAAITATALHRLSEVQEKALLAHLAKFPEMVGVSAEQNAPHGVAFYLRDTADLLHSYYNAIDTAGHRIKFIVEDDAELTQARLALVVATRQVIRNGLALLGVSAPESM
ncbi:MAG: arginine--tRNA ligase [Panacagrimonas sp.]